MAIKIVRKQRKNANGTYDIIHPETQAKAVWFADGQSIQTKYENGDLAGSKTAVFTATIGTSWSEDSDTGVKSQTVAIDGVTADHTAKVDNYYNGDGTSDSYAAFVEQQNQYLECVTNGYAETVSGGIKFYIFGNAPTVAIPIIVEVV